MRRKSFLKKSLQSVWNRIGHYHNTSLIPSFVIIISEFKFSKTSETIGWVWISLCMNTISLSTISIQLYRALKEKEKYLDETGKEIGEEELAKRLEVTLEDLKLALESTNAVASLYEAVYSDNEEEILLIDQLSDELIINDKIVNTLTLKKALKSLNEMQVRIINDRYSCTFD